MFGTVDFIFNPKSSSTLSGQPVPPVLVRHFFPDQKVLRDQDLDRLIKALSADPKSRNVDRLKNFRNLEVKAVVALFDKADKQNVNDD